MQLLVSRMPHTRSCTRFQDKICDLQKPGCAVGWLSLAYGNRCAVPAATKRAAPPQRRKGSTVLSSTSSTPARGRQRDAAATMRRRHGSIGTLAATAARSPATCRPRNPPPDPPRRLSQYTFGGWRRHGLTLCCSKRQRRTNDNLSRAATTTGNGRRRTASRKIQTCEAFSVHIGSQRSPRGSSHEHTQLEFARAGREWCTRGRVRAGGPRGPHLSTMVRRARRSGLAPTLAH
jgi:hypothetical protein